MGIRIWLPSIRARSGADVYVERLASELEKLGHEPIIQWFRHSYQYAPSLLRNVKAPEGTDVIHANSWNAFAFSRPGIPLVAAVLHCVFRRGYPEWKSFPQSVFHDHFVGRFERKSFEAADAVVAISDSTRLEVISDFGINNVTAIPLWVDNDVFTPINNSNRDRSTKIRILIVGNMGKRKGGDLIGPLCEALGPDYEVLVVAGLRGEAPTASARGATLSFASGLSLAELIEKYRQSDIVVSLSRHEGFGYTALEAMACGKPVVAFDVSGLRDVISHGECGTLVRVNDVAAMAAACNDIRNTPDLLIKLGAQARLRAVKKFTATSSAQSQIELYRQVISNRSAKHT